MTITIAHLYYNLLNLYGESGNVKALQYQLESQGIHVKIKFLTLGDTLNFDDYDFIYIGAGTEENQKLALKHLMKYKEEVKKAIEEETFFLITGNSLELFGKCIIDKKEKRIKALHAFDFYTKQENFRMVDEALVKSKFIKPYILGFQNQGSVIKSNENVMFEVIKGIGSFPNSKIEGIHYNHFYGTYLIGPILVRNPELLKYFVKQLIKSKQADFKLKRFNLSLETKAYDEFMKHYYSDYINE